MCALPVKLQLPLPVQALARDRVSSSSKRWQTKSVRFLQRAPKPHWSQTRSWQPCFRNSFWSKRHTILDQDAKDRHKSTGNLVALGQGGCLASAKLPSHSPRARLGPNNGGAISSRRERGANRRQHAAQDSPPSSVSPYASVHLRAGQVKLRAVAYVILMSMVPKPPRCPTHAAGPREAVEEIPAGRRSVSRVPTPRARKTAASAASHRNIIC